MCELQQHQTHYHLNMSRFALLSAAVLLATLSPGLSFQDYYWRNYDGSIPEDAVLANKDSDGHVYIGQAYVEYQGLVTGQIDPGVALVNAAYGEGSVTAMTSIKILCSSQRDFYWQPVQNARQFLSMVESKSGVKGGHLDSSGAIYVAKTIYQNKTKIGWANSGSIHFDDDGVERTWSAFEVLVYDSKTESKEGKETARRRGCLE